MDFQPVQMADDEWGNVLMQDIARKLLGDRTDLTVEVREHAGWWLQFANVNGQMTTVGSANDAGRYSDAVRDWWKQTNATKTNYLPTINRQLV